MTGSKAISVTELSMQPKIMKRSEIQTIKYDAPQGSILGPLLFCIYINDLSQSIKDSKIHHFADDANLLYASISQRH